jgi:hypothetical protein
MAGAHCHIYRWSLLSVRAKSGIEFEFQERWMREPRDRNNNKQIGGTKFVVKDAFIWAEIFYLDSATDYRECISIRQTTPPNDEMTMLNGESCWPSLRRWHSVMKHTFTWLLTFFSAI